MEDRNGDLSRRADRRVLHMGIHGKQPSVGFTLDRRIRYGDGFNFRESEQGNRRAFALDRDSPLEI